MTGRMLVAAIAVLGAVAWASPPPTASAADGQAALVPATWSLDQPAYATQVRHGGHGGGYYYGGGRGHGGWGGHYYGNSRGYYGRPYYGYFGGGGYYYSTPYYYPAPYYYSYPGYYYRPAPGFYFSFGW